MSEPSHRKRKAVLWPLLLVIFAFALYTQRQYIYDQVKLYGYSPPVEISALATEASMTDNSRRVFYVNRPELKQRSNFSQFCSTGTEQTVVLGCYKAPQRGIYLLAVSNAELKGIEQVTAAHEMLHAEYDRLSKSERTRIDELLQDYYDTKLKDATIKKTIDGYRKTEPNDLVNEMHSIIGTQVANLPAEMEQYYSQYFKDRASVVNLYGLYEKAFSSRQDQIKTYDQVLTNQKNEIETLETTVTQQGESLQSQRSRLDRLQSSNDISAYNAGVDSYNAAANAYNASIRRLRAVVDSYNALVEKRNAIAFEEQSLVEAISAPDAAEQR